MLRCLTVLIYALIVSVRTDGIENMVSQGAQSAPGPSAAFELEQNAQNRKDQMVPNQTIKKNRNENNQETQSDTDQVTQNKVRQVVRAKAGDEDIDKEDRTNNGESGSGDEVVESPYEHHDDRWRLFAFRWFDHMDTPIFRDYKYGFPPGFYGSSLMPTMMWYHLWGNRNVKEMFLQPKNVILVNLDYMRMIHSCDELTQPRCSWHYFLGLLYPTGYNRKLLEFLIPNLSELQQSQYYPVPIIHGSCYPFTSVDQMSLIYIYSLCHALRNQSTINPFNTLQICPNPCARRPCKLIERAVDGSCKNIGFHIKDFQCTCEEGYEWESSMMLCSVVDNCNKICNQTTTASCLVNRTSATAICQCKDGYMGYDCSQPYDACVLGTAPDARGLNVGPIIPSGYDACGTTLDARNLCFNVPGANTYTCVCSPAYVRDISVPYDNCLKPLDSCDKRICVHGQCVTAPDLLKSVCNCDEGYTGNKCDQPTGTWSTWSQWSICEPPCGPARHRRRVRMCMSDNEGDCIGPVEEVRRCPDGLGCVQDVAVEEETWLEFVSWTNYAMMITLSYIGSLAILLSIVGLCRRYRRPLITTDSDNMVKLSAGPQTSIYRTSRLSIDKRLQQLSTDSLRS